MFLRFLKHNKAYGYYIYALSNEKATSFRTYHNGDDLENPEEFIILQTHYNPYNLISNAFQWSNTRQGSYYWLDLHHKWVSALNKLNEIVEK